MHPDWPRSLRDQCIAAGVPFHFKQWGEWAPIDDHPDAYTGTTKGGHLGFSGEWSSPTAKIWGTNHPPVFMVRVGKKAAGRLLDGREWNEMPERSHA